MLSFDVATTFFLASCLLALTPGPDNLFVLAQSALQGAAAGLLVMLGLCSGLVVHSLAVALGAAAIFQSSALAFFILKLCGAGYLLYLAFVLFTARAQASVYGDMARLGAGVLYRRGIIMNLTNPKVSIFFLAFLPQFADPARGSMVLQMLALGALFILATLCVFGAIALLAGRLRGCFSGGAGFHGLLARLSGLVFVGLAIRLVMTER
ncbi:MAG: threonine transporter RhtB [Gammaproteobacteria bacterium HGW-Gammaproteobacteria-6]|nr:MAG: threonine transporter RhtB [Gammaproteobacteria bacterium HGW-Gammaproteobacteria-6]